MCGFIGVASRKDINNSFIKDADKFLTCRGPDDQKWSENSLDNYKTLFSFHRLSIIDLSPEASQPMSSEKYNTEILFNGEIYNHLELRKEMELDGIKFSTSHSDTETLLLGLSEHGSKFIEKVDGQFSIVLLNKNLNTITLIRDRLGQKPLYYFIDRDNFIFSSNFKSVLSYKKRFDLDQSQIANFLELGCIPAPYTLDKEIKKLLPAEILEFSLETFSVRGKTKYWRIEDYVDESKFEKEKFFHLFNNSVKKRLLSDVPIANLLSGGIDSTSIIKSQFDNKVKNINTFTIKNTEKQYDESGWANKVSSNYNTNHHIVEIDGSNLTIDPFEVIKSFDEPYSDPSIFPSHMIYKNISNKFKVALSGDGGDELIGGYEKLIISMKKGFLPSFIVKILLKLYPAKYGTGGGLSSFVYSPDLSYLLLTKDRKLLDLLSMKQVLNFKNTYFSKMEKDLKKLIISDYKFYFSELMLLKVDRTSMANSLEVRSPFLDHKLIEYVLSTDFSFFDTNNSKSILKEYLREDFADDFLNRDKMGFVFDLESWIFSNKDILVSKIYESQIFKESNFEKLFKRKTRINAIRILKILTLSIFIEDYISISSK